MQSPESKTESSAQFSVGSVLSRSFAILFKNPGVFFGLVLLATLPPAIIDGLVGSETMSSVMGIVSSILALVVEGAIAYGVFKVLRGENAGLSESFNHGMSRMGPLVLAAILTGLGIGVGLLLFVIPGLILSCLWAVTIPACAVEKLGALDSMKRSAELTKGYRLKIFALMAIVTLAILAIGIAIMYIFLQFTESYLMISVISALVVLVPQTYYAVMSAVIYYDLREIKEGVSIESLANVFD